MQKNVWCVRVSKIFNMESQLRDISSGLDDNFLLAVLGYGSRRCKRRPWRQASNHLATATDDPEQWTWKKMTVHLGSVKAAQHRRERERGRQLHNYAQFGSWVCCSQISYRLSNQIMFVCIMIIKSKFCLRHHWIGFSVMREVSHELVGGLGHFWFFP